MAAINVQRVVTPKKRYGMLRGGVIRKRLEEEHLPDFWFGDRRRQFPLALKCRDGWAGDLMERQEWLFSNCPVALIQTVFPAFQILVDPIGEIRLQGLPDGVDTWDIFDFWLCVNPAASDKDIAMFVAEATFLALREAVACGVEALTSVDLSELIEIILIKEDDGDQTMFFGFSTNHRP